MNYFDSVIDQLSDEEKVSINLIFQEWLNYAHWRISSEFNQCDHKKVIENIRSEHFLDFDIFLKAIKDLIAHFKNNIEQCLSVFRQLAYVDFLLQGKPIQAKPTYIATTVLKDVFFGYAKKQGFSDCEIIKIISKSPERFNRAERKLFMKRPFLLIWFSWDEDMKSYPHRFLKEKTKLNICDAMALADDYRKHDLLAFYFQHRDDDPWDFTIFRPTWCDADFFDKFKPTDPRLETKWGQTNPEITYPIRPKFDVRRPEGVAKSGEIPLKFLSDPIEMLN